MATDRVAPVRVLDAQRGAPVETPAGTIIAAASTATTRTTTPAITRAATGATTIAIAAAASVQQQDRDGGDRMDEYDEGDLEGDDDADSDDGDDGDDQGDEDGVDDFGSGRQAVHAFDITVDARDVHVDISECVRTDADFMLVRIDNDNENCTVINSGRISMEFQLSVCLIAYCPFRGTPSSSVCLKKNNSQKIMSEVIVFVLRR